MPTFTNGIQITGGVTITKGSSDVTPDITLSDWESINGATISEPTSGTFRFVRTHASDSFAGYYEFTGLTADQDYRIDFEYRLVTGSIFRVYLQRALGSQVIGTASTSNTSFQSSYETWTQESANNGKFFLKTEVLNAQNHSGEIRSITLTEV